MSDIRQNLSSDSGSNRDNLPVPVPLRHWGRYISAVIMTIACLYFALVVSRSQEVTWPAIPEFLFNPAVLRGVVVTIQLTVGSMVIGIVLGTILATMRMSQNPVFITVSVLYIWFFRGTPLMVQIFFWFNIALFVPSIGIAGYSVSMNTVITASTAGLLALSLHEAANMAEIVRGGILSVDSGQTEASQALGLTKRKAMRRIVLPQAVRIIIPPTGNQAIGMLKATAMVSVIGTHDLLTQVQNTYARNFLVIELLCVAAIWYLFLTSLATIGQHFLERHYEKGYAPTNKKLATRLWKNVLVLPFSSGKV